MKTMFEQLMEGLDEVDAYLQGEREGYRVRVLGCSDEASSSAATTAKTKSGASACGEG